MDENWKNLQVNDFFLKNTEFGQKTGFGFFAPFLVKNIIPMGVDNWFFFVDFYWLVPMRMVADYQIGAGVNGFFG